MFHLSISCVSEVSSKTQWNKNRQTSQQLLYSKRIEISNECGAAQIMWIRWDLFESIVRSHSDIWLLTVKSEHSLRRRDLFWNTWGYWCLFSQETHLRDRTLQHKSTFVLHSISLLSKRKKTVVWYEHSDHSVPRHTSKYHDITLYSLIGS